MRISDLSSDVCSSDFIRYSRAADKALAKMPAKIAGLIEDKIEQVAADPDSLANNTTELRGTAFRRLRVGDYRVIMDDLGNVLDILDVGQDRKSTRLNSSH